jgi:AcrR family transcriptional regulator
VVQVKGAKKSRSRVLKAACKVFGKKGYRDARIADICRQAGTNVASVNYYFGSKAALYAEAWKHDQARSKRSRFITLFHAATKSCTNFSWESSHP